MSVLYRLHEIFGLKTVTTRRFFWALFVSLMVLQVMLATQTAVFGDEAFYWLESQFLQPSYSEIPGFVPWLNAVSTAFLPHHPFFLRLPFLLACWALPWLVFVLIMQLSQSKQAAWQAALMTLIVPLIGLTGVLAIADIWLLFFILLSVLFWIRLIHTGQSKQAFYLGLTLMLAVNVHIRFWFVLFMALLAAVVVYKQSLLKVKALWQITLPLTLLGFAPIILFNSQHGFPLLGFQLGERNPWQFQINHLWFFLGQIVITTPLVFYLCLVSLKKPVNCQDERGRAVRFIQVLALSYWLLYAILGFFSDNLRTNIHWPLPAYLLLLLVAATFEQRYKRLKRWAIITGALAHCLFLIGFYLLLHVWPVTSNNHKQLINNAIGWPELTAKVEQLHEPGQLIIADYFMTAAALNYSHNDRTWVPALAHPMNIKHGREMQLSLMNLLYQETPVQPALLVVEHTALKLTQQIPFYQQSCAQLNGLTLLDDLSVRSGSKLYYFFSTGGGDCDLPPIVYHNYQQAQHQGWVMVKKETRVQLDAIFNDGQESRVIHLQAEPLGQAELFSTVDAKRYQRLSYQLENGDSIQLRIETDRHRLLTQRFYR